MSAITDDVRMSYTGMSVEEEEPGDLTCVAKLTDRWDRALISARQLTPV